MMEPPESSQLKTRLELAVNIARQAGDSTLELFRSSSLKTERKQDGSPVTVADRTAEQLMRRLIAESFPDDAILGEEFGESDGASGYRWVLDPIDGTKTFVCGVPTYTTLVAVLKEDQPRIGVIYAPAASEMVYAAAGQGCWHVADDAPPQPARVSSVDKLNEAVFITTSVRSYTSERKADARDVYDRLESACLFARTWGDAYGYLLVATGRAEFAVDPAMSLWDTASLQPIIEEAGGKFFDWQGTPTIYNEESIATNAALADQVLALIRDY